MTTNQLAKNSSISFFLFILFLLVRSSAFLSSLSLSLYRHSHRHILKHDFIWLTIVLLLPNSGIVMSSGPIRLLSVGIGAFRCCRARRSVLLEEGVHHLDVRRLAVRRGMRRMVRIMSGVLSRLSVGVQRSQTGDAPLSSVWTWKTDNRRLSTFCSSVRLARPSHCNLNVRRIFSLNSTSFRVWPWMMWVP